MNLENINLSEKIKKNLHHIGYQQLTDIQLKTIPLILEEQDMIVQSQTGTGKTGAFLIPILDKIERGFKPQVLILVPTRELALQVSEEARKLSSHSNLRILTIYGQDSIRRQSKLFNYGVDVIIGTTGRTIDHIFKQKTFSLEHLKFVVLDEVDEMINQGFLPDVEKNLKKVPVKRQTLFFSATVSDKVKLFARKFAKNPIIITSKNNDLPSKTEHFFLEVNSSWQKKQNLIAFLSENKLDSVLVFANTKRRVEEIKNTLRENGLQVDCIHSDLPQNRRTRIFNNFRSKRISLLIATDVAARGLDIKDISYVINYDFPQNREFYIHRTGRTGRAGASGKAITFINISTERGGHYFGKRAVVSEKRQLFAIAQQKNFKVEKFIINSPLTKVKTPLETDKLRGDERKFNQKKVFKKNYWTKKDNWKKRRTSY